MSASSFDRAAVVIVGGGVLGCSIAWHLARKGVTDVLVLERNELGSGATSRSAGLVARGRLHAPTMAMVRRTRDAIAELERVLGEDIGFRRVGSVRVTRGASGADDLIKMDRMLTDSGIGLRNISEAEAHELVPWLDASGASRISYVEDDGYVDAYRLSTAYARAARALGVRFLDRCLRMQSSTPAARGRSTSPKAQGFRWEPHRYVAITTSRHHRPSGPATTRLSICRMRARMRDQKLADC
jgi:4-methylaminobutanoate oxidase (formaldehyde-forming)